MVSADLPALADRFPSSNQPTYFRGFFRSIFPDFSFEKTSQHIYVSTIKVCSFDILGSKRPYEQRKIVGSLYQIRT